MWHVEDSSPMHRTHIHFLVIVALFLVSVYIWHWRWFEGLGNMRNATQTSINSLIHMYRLFSLYLLSPFHLIIPYKYWNNESFDILCDVSCGCRYYHLDFGKYSRKRYPNGSELKNENAILSWWWKWKPPSRFPISTKRIQLLNIYLFWHAYLAVDLFLIVNMKIYFADLFFFCRHSING